MSDHALSYRAIGVIHTPHRDPEKTPIQPVYSGDFAGEVEVFPEFEEGLADIEGFSHVYLLYHLHRAGPPRLSVKPFLQDEVRGLFATRAPCRPNPIGLSIVALKGRQGNVLRVEGVDMLDGSPLLDIKPYAARFDRIDATRNGWQDDVEEPEARRRGRRDAPDTPEKNPPDEA